MLTFTGMEVQIYNRRIVGMYVKSCRLDPSCSPPQGMSKGLRTATLVTHTQVPQTQSQMLHYGMWVHTSFSSTSNAQCQHSQNRFIQNLALFTSIYRTGNSISSVWRLKADPCGLVKGIRWQIWLGRDIPTTGTCSQTHPVEHCWISMRCWKKT